MRNEIGTKLLAIGQLAVIILAAVFSAAYLELFMIQLTFHGLSLGLEIGRAILLFAFFLALYMFVGFRGSRLFHFLYKYRYVLGFVLFALLVAFEVSFSSIGIWENFLPDSQGSGIVWGTYRSIRGDEWGITVPFYLAQGQNEFYPLNDILRGTETCVTLSPALPAYAVITLFRPGYWGFLLFGVSRGIAWIWAFHLVCTFLFTVDFVQIITKNKTLSVTSGLLVTFSPCIQWWGSLEAVVFGELIIILLFWLLNGKNRIGQFFAAIGLPWACGCYLFLAYPPWQVPFFYIFLIVGLWVIISFVRRHRDSGEESERKRFSFMLLVPLCCSLLIVALLTVYSFYEGAPSIEGTAKTIYPGGRSSAGGGALNMLLDWCIGVFFAIAPDNSVVPNTCEAATFFSLFPISLLIGLFALVKTRNKLLLALLVLDVFFLLYVIFGIPEIIAKFTLLSMSTASRLAIPETYLEIVILILSLSFLSRADKFEKNVSYAGKRGIGVAGVVIALLLLCFLLVPLTPLTLASDAFWSKRIIILFVLMILMLSLTAFLTMVSYRAFYRTFLVVVLAVVAISGVCVNPVQQGIGVITDNDLYEEIEKVADENPEALWIAEGGLYFSNLCVAAGAPTLSSTNTYPNDEAWATLDPNGDYEEVYMRYSNIAVDVENDFGDADTFVLNSADFITLNLTPEQLCVLNVRYLLADEEHTDTDAVKFNEIFRAEGPVREFVIYELEYQ